MRLSNETIKILKNYAAINNSLLFSKGNVLKTVSGEKTILASATIQEEIPFDFAIYDLSSMLAMLSCLNDPEIICHSKKVEIKSSQGQQGSFDMYYSDASLIATPPDKEISTIPVYSFDLSADEMQTMMKAIAVTGSPELTIKCEDNKVVLKAGSRDNETHSSYTKELGSHDGSDFDVYIDIVNFKVIHDDYEIVIASTMNKRSAILNFKSKNKAVEYWLACGLNSVLKVKDA